MEDLNRLAKERDLQKFLDEKLQMEQNQQALDARRKAMDDSVRRQMAYQEAQQRMAEEQRQRRALEKSQRDSAAMSLLQQSLFGLLKNSDERRERRQREEELEDQRRAQEEARQNEAAAARQRQVAMAQRQREEDLRRQEEASRQQAELERQRNTRLRQSLANPFGDERSTSSTTAGANPFEAPASGARTGDTPIRLASNNPFDTPAAPANPFAPANPYLTAASAGSGTATTNEWATCERDLKHWESGYSAEIGKQPDVCKKKRITAERATQAAAIYRKCPVLDPSGKKAAEHDLVAASAKNEAEWQCQHVNVP